MLLNQKHDFNLKSNESKLKLDTNQTDQSPDTRTALLADGRKQSDLLQESEF